MISWSKNKKAGWRVEYSNPYTEHVYHVKVYNPAGTLVFSDSACRLTSWGRWLYIRSCLRKAMKPSAILPGGNTKVIQY